MIPQFILSFLRDCRFHVGVGGTFLWRGKMVTLSIACSGHCALPLIDVKSNFCFLDNHLDSELYLDGCPLLVEYSLKGNMEGGATNF